MTKPQKIVATGLWGLLTIAMVALIASGTGARSSNSDPDPVFTATTRIVQPELPPIYLPDFALTDQSNQPFLASQLHGRPAILSFIFTRCQGPCPAMTTKLSTLQPELDKKIQLISFTVDPDHDTPAVLAEYAATHHADLTRWRFLTGPKETIYSIASELKLAALPADADNPIIHSTRFILLDPAGKAHGYFDYDDAAKLADLVQQANTLAASLPASAPTTAEGAAK
jgi:protein SCO1/2